MIGVAAATAIALINLSQNFEAWKFLVVNGLFFAQPVLFFALRYPLALKLAALAALAYVTYIVFPALLANLGLGPALSPIHAKGLWPNYWIFCALTGILNICIVPARLTGILK